MVEHAASCDQLAFVAELDDVAGVLKGTAGHVQHEGWSLRSTGTLVCSCGAALYAPERAPAPSQDPGPPI